ncbi:MAG: O-antigen ligase family protein [bacterium]
MWRMIREMARWVLVLAVFYAPWAYGCTNEATNRGLVWLLSAALGLWGVACLGSWRKPHVSSFIVVVSAMILLLGWGMTLNAKNFYDVEFRDVLPLPYVLWNGGPGSYANVLSEEIMWRVTVLLGVVWMASDLARNKAWLQKLLAAMALAGCSIALFGLVQKCLNIPSFFWEGKGYGPSVFATYKNDANAGAYLNLIVPVVMGFLVLAVARGKRHFLRTLWLVALILLLGSALVHTSRAATIMTGVLVLVFLAWRRNFFFWLLGRSSRLPLMSGLAAFLVALVVVALAVGMKFSVQSWMHWEDTTNTAFGRLAAYGAWLSMVPEAGWFGFGPGTFQAAALSYAPVYPSTQAQNWWRYAHEDYLQTIIEWGFVGAVLWAVLFGGAVWRGYRRLKQGNGNSLTEKTLMGCVWLALLGVMVHSFVDFPLQIGSIQYYVALYLGVLWSNALPTRIEQAGK